MIMSMIDAPRENVTKIRRKEEILNLLYENGHVEVRDISRRFNVSEATTRRDLRRMADEGLLELVYGGATLPRKGNYSINSRKTRNIDAKRIIGRVAAGLVKNGDSLFLDSGTTCACMASNLRARKNLSIITNSNPIAAEIGENTDFNILQLGGKFRHERMDSVGPFAQLVIEQLSGYRAFIGCDGLDMNIGLTSTDIDTAHLYRTVVEHAAEATLLIDHTKFSAPSLYKIIKLTSVNRIVTDKAPDRDWIEYLEGNDIDLIVQETASAGSEE